MAAPLDGVKVIDVTQYVAGPFCTMILGDLGAEVIKIEMAGRGDIYRVQGPNFVEGEATSFLGVNRNKKSLTLNLKEQRGLTIAKRLAEGADIFVQNFKPGTADRLGLGYDDLIGINPSLIYCSISGYGQTGPDRNRGGYDLMAQARGGIMSLTGSSDGDPVKVGVPVLDMGAAMYAVIGILAAYASRQQTGRGQHVDVSLLDTAVSWCAVLAMEYWITGKVPGRMGSASPLFAPYQSFKAQDGDLSVIGTGGKDHWERFCRALEKEEWINDPRFVDNAERIANLDELEKLIENVLSEAPVKVWVDRLSAAGLPCEPLQTLDQVLVDRQLVAREMVTSTIHPRIGELKMTGVPIKLSNTPAGVFAPPPLKGQHVGEILRSLGYSENEIAAMEKSGIV